MLEFDAHGNENFYRAMKPRDYANFEITGVVPTGETFISPSQAYSSGYDGVLVRMTVRPGTAQQLMDIGVAGNPGTSSLFTELPAASKGWANNNAMFKLETPKGRPEVGSVVNIGLGKGKALDLFNSNIIKHERLN